jgi:hypothetical protein
VHAAARTQYRALARAHALACAAAAAAAADGAGTAAADAAAARPLPPLLAFKPPRVRFILACNKTDIAPCSLHTAEAASRAGLAFVAVSARNETNTRHLWRMIQQEVADADTQQQQAQHAHAQAQQQQQTQPQRLAHDADPAGLGGDDGAPRRRASQPALGAAFGAHARA